MTLPEERETISPPRPGAGKTPKETRGFIYDDEGMVRYVPATTGLHEGDGPSRPALPQSLRFGARGLPRGGCTEGGTP